MKNNCMYNFLSPFYFCIFFFLDFTLLVMVGHTKKKTYITYIKHTYKQEHKLVYNYSNHENAPISRFKARELVFNMNRINVHCTKTCQSSAHFDQHVKT